jgi:hypothetical protein
MAGGSWLGTIRYDDTTLKSSCGWRMVFKFGRLAELYSPKSEKYEFSILRDGTRTVTYNGKVVLTIKRKFNDKSLFFDYYATYTNAGKQHTAILKMGERPIIQQMTYYDTNDRPITRDEQKNAITLRAVQIDNAPEKRFDFTVAAMTVASVPFKWDTKDNRCTECDGKKFSFRKIRGILCSQTTFKDGTVALRGQDSKRGIEIEQQNSGPIVVTEKFVNGICFDKIRAISQMDNYGNERENNRYWYDENGNLIKFSFVENGKKFYLQKNKLTNVLYDNKNNLLWQKTYDVNGRIVEFSLPSKKFFFAYLPNNLVDLKCVSGRKEITRRLPAAQLSNIFLTLNGRSQ